MRFPPPGLQALPGLTRRIRHAVPVMAIAALAGCGGIFEPFACTDEGSFAIHLHILDAATGETKAAGSRVTVRSDGSEEEFEVPEWFGTVVPIGPEQTGVFDLTVRRAGYSTWTRNGIVVGRAGRCRKLQSVTVVAALTRN